MNPKQLLKQFKEVPWLSQQQLDEVVEESLAGGVDANTIGRMLGILLDPRQAGDSWKERMRHALFARLAPRVLDRGLCVQYVRALKDAPQGLRKLLLSLIPQVEHPGAHAELCEFLRSPDKTLRQLILEILPSMQRAGIATQLHKLMRRPDFAGAPDVLELLLQIDYANAMQALEHTIKKGEPAAQEIALQYLAKRGKGRAEVGLKLVRTALSAPVERVRIAAIEAFSALCSEQLYFEVIAPLVDDSKISIGRAALRGAQHFRTKRTMRMLERAFTKGPEGISLTVLQVLEIIGNDSILPVLVKALAHPQLMVRSQAGDVLANLGRTGKVELARAVIWLLRSRDENVRRIAAELSRSVSDPQDQFWPKIMTFLLDEDWWVRERVMDTLMESAPELLARYIVQYLSAPSSVVRLFAVEVLGRLRKPEALGILVRTALNDEDWWVREKAIEAIGELGDPRGVAYIIDIMQREESLQWSCIQTLDKLRAVEMSPHVAALLRAPSSDIRLVALRCLASFRALQHAPEVEPLQQDPDPEVRKRANELIEQWKIRAEYGQQHLHVEPLDQLLIHAHQMQGDDLLLAPGRRAFIKKLGKVLPLSDYVFNDEQLRSILIPHLAPQQLKNLNAMGEVDFSHEIKDKRLRFRAHVFHQHNGIAAVFRLLRGNWLQLSELGLPPIVRSFGDWKDGLVLIGGPTGSGKTMTISALIDEINQTSNRHIVSLEDPIEVVHRPSSCLINQREIGSHTRSFTHALRATLRQDPDVILVGEMRDFDTISFAMTAADTGHLVLGTLHTVSADATVDRILNAYPSNQQEQARSMLAQNLRVVLCQNLLRGKSGVERHLAAEVMLNNDAVSNMIRKGKTHQLSSTIGSSRESGMQTMDQEIQRLHQEGLISPEEAYMRARNKKEFEWMMGGEEAIEALHSGLAKKLPARSEAALSAVAYRAEQEGSMPSLPQAAGRAAPGSMTHMVAHASRAQERTGERPKIRTSSQRPSIPTGGEELPVATGRVVSPERPQMRAGSPPASQRGNPAMQPSNTAAHRSGARPPMRPAGQPTRPAGQPTRPAGQPTRPAGQPARPTGGHPTQQAGNTAAHRSGARPPMRPAQQDASRRPGVRDSGLDDAQRARQMLAGEAPPTDPASSRQASPSDNAEEARRVGGYMVNRTTGGERAPARPSQAQPVRSGAPPQRRPRRGDDPPKRS